MTQIQQHYGVEDRLSEYWKQIEDSINQHLARWGIALLLLLGVGGWILFISGMLTDYSTNFITEMLGVITSVVITVLVLDRRAERRETERLKQDLVRRASSPSNEIAKDAIDELRHHGWLKGKDGLLEEANLRDANLQGTHTGEANLQRANLRDANLYGADLWKANLQGADLGEAELQRANLWVANLQRANLNGANLQEADLNGAHLQRAIFGNANLQRADLSSAELQRANLNGANLQRAVVTDFKDIVTLLDENTTLPNGAKYDPAQGLEQLELFGVTVVKSWEEYEAWRKEQRNKDNQ